jgi:hypothetical protein
MVEMHAQIARIQTKSLLTKVDPSLGPKFINKSLLIFGPEHLLLNGKML